MSLRLTVSGVGAALLAGAICVASLPEMGLAQTQPAAQAPVLGAATAAFVGDDAISTYALKQRMSWLAVSRPTPPTQAEIPELQREALSSLIDERIQAQELKRREEQFKLKPGTLLMPDDVVDDAIANMAQSNNMTAEQFSNILQTRGVNVKNLREQIRIAISWNEWIRSYYGRRVVISDEKVDAMLRDIAEASSKPSYLISEIFVDSGRAGGVDAAAAAAGQIIDLVRQNANFQTLAQQYSSLPSARNGGDAGWLTTAELEPEIVRAIENLRPGEIAPPIKTVDGAYVIMVREKRAGSTAAVVNLKQAAIALPADATPQAVQQAQTQLAAIKARASGGCGSLEAAVQGARGVSVGDLGESEVKDLAPSFRTAVETLQPNQISDPVRTPAGLHLIAVCSRSMAGADMPTREQVVSNLRMRELAMIERRELRNLRQAATISQPR